MNVPPTATNRAVTRSIRLLVRVAKRNMLAWLPLAGTVTAGCHHTYHTATPVAEGRVEVSASITGWTSKLPAVLPVPEAAIRYGMSETSDVGIRFFPIGLGVDYNHAIINSKHFALSLNPEIQVGLLPGYEENDGEFVYSGNLNVLVDALKFEHVILTLAARPGFTVDDDTTFTPGVGALLKLKMSERFSIAPGIDVMRPRDGDRPTINAHFGFYFR